MGEFLVVTSCNQMNEYLGGHYLLLLLALFMCSPLVGFLHLFCGCGLLFMDYVLDCISAVHTFFEFSYKHQNAGNL
jgi:hypothetical protein